MTSEENNPKVIQEWVLKRAAQSADLSIAFLKTVMTMDPVSESLIFACLIGNQISAISGVAQYTANQRAAIARITPEMCRFAGLRVLEERLAKRKAKRKSNQ